MSPSDDATARVRLRRGRARPLWARNPSVFSSSILRVEGRPGDGDVVAILDHRGKFIARGLWAGSGPVRIWAFTWREDEELDGRLFRRRIEAAWSMRRDLLGLPDEATDAFRVVHGAGDGLPGLVVDRYRDWLGVRFGFRGLERRRDEIGSILLEVVGARGVWVSPELSLRSREEEEPFSGGLVGEEPPEVVEFRENGLRFATSLRGGPKTGHFLDQRENRRRAAEFVRGRRVLDAFCSTGGFALAAEILGGAREVTAVEESSDALAMARENARRNGAERTEWVRGDAFAVLREIEAAGERFGMVVLDPPAFARTARQKAGALRGYKEINLRGLGLLEPGGVLVTCSCSSPVTFEDLERVLREAGMDRGIDVRILERRGQPPDHPVPAAAPEAGYLKVVIATV